MLFGENDFYWHQRIARLLAAAGFKTTRIEREDVHPVWRVWMKQDAFAPAPDYRGLVEQVRSILLAGRLKIDNEIITSMDLDGNGIHLMFTLNLGAPGVWQGNLSPARRRKQGELWPGLR